MVRQTHLIAVVGAFLIAVVMVGCGSGPGNNIDERDGEGGAAATNEETTAPKGGRSAAGTALAAEITCQPHQGNCFGTTNDDTITGTAGWDDIYARRGDDIVKSLGGLDLIVGGPGNDTIHGNDRGDTLEDGAGNDIVYGGQGGDWFAVLFENAGNDTYYGGEGNDEIVSADGDRDELYCGEGKDRYDADKVDYVDSSCEKKSKWGPIIE